MLLSAHHGVPCADLGVPVSLTWIGRALPCARMVEINRQKCLPDPLTFFADRPILRGLGGSVEPTGDGAHLEGPPIREDAP